MALRKFMPHTRMRNDHFDYVIYTKFIDDQGLSRITKEEKYFLNGLGDWHIHQPNFEIYFKLHCFT